MRLDDHLMPTPSFVDLVRDVEKGKDLLEHHDLSFLSCEDSTYLKQFDNFDYTYFGSIGEARSNYSKDFSCDLTEEDVDDVDDDGDRIEDILDGGNGLEDEFEVVPDLGVEGVLDDVSRDEIEEGEEADSNRVKEVNVYPK
ncbi:OLC1v1008686C1 [Oldenlandia corymbosa var. corymbosa]|uniref:OLC1v1008686C1 n=1 Tax=Oldenlandia corymbosa var. corymbosa TaxID=529605 RepID=A0AAV1DM33_OLDCO|nr:OLC1v1008686C1 [Oldenlandia corymbosa var. corymbosa]